ncbi:MAG TPA: hypothetical protein VFN67_34450 [Polyangiales bacterium]|nr:hypothetical protein [Polyangiales bacterium]
MHFSSRFFFAALLCTCLLPRSAPVLAQSQQILVVSGEEVPEKLYDAVSDALGDLGSVMSPSGYTGNLRARSQEPDSEEALTKIAPQMGASLIVVLKPARNKLKVELRDGHSGKVIKATSVPARGKRPKLAGPARKRLLAAAKRALSKVGPAPAPTARPSTRVDDEEEEDDFAAQPSPPTAARATNKPSQPTRSGAPVRQAEPEEADDTSFEESSDDEPPPHDKHASKSGESPSIWFPLHAGLGVGSRSILVPTQPSYVGGNRVDTAFAPALDIGVGLGFALGPAWQLRALIDYRTILALNAAYQTPTGMKSLSSLSSHSIIAGASLGHVSDGLDSFGVHVFLGWAYRGLSAAEPSLPSASIQGVVLRPEFEIPIANRALTLRLAPELILVLVQAATLPANNSGVSGGVGYALGIEAELALHISQSVGLSLQFRESRGSSPSSWGSSESENERYITLRFQLRL